MEEIYQDQKNGEQGGPCHNEGKGEGGGEDPPKTPPYSLHFLYGSLRSPFEKKKKYDGKIDFNMPQLKLDIKFELPIYNGELNDEKLDNWIRQIEVYCRIQKFTEDSIKIQLASLWVGGTALIWWERVTQQDISTIGKIISSWYKFNSSLNKQLYLLGYMKQAIME